MNQTARDVSALSPDPWSTEVAVLSGAVFGAAFSFRPTGTRFDVLVATELVREPGPEPSWPVDDDGIEQLIVSALLRPGCRPSPSATGTGARSRAGRCATDSDAPSTYPAPARPGQTVPMSNDIADAVLALPPFSGISYRALRATDGMPPRSS
ncbi:hypothetical protein GCM10025865_09830 [Paraoerskovia sediminicola]|uniref:Uncharacterized protein n=1 Tax=Paraoerskovia sediminicola TaxID=1138587 RepID=A0ABM8G0N3_9CELL|nr:hypothetical protein [Paraoerskovia sediminicola]BDZ41684.1 hypothetical protein GCM10025865_09830 [Paraoerskovia sediminicola]